MRRDMGHDNSTAPRILVVGAGCAGMATARRLERMVRPNEAAITVVDPRPYMTYPSFLPETAAGTVEPRHVVAPLRALLRRCQVFTGEVTHIDTDTRAVGVRLPDDNEAELGYDVLVLAAGSVTKVLPVPGLQEHATGFTTLGEAVLLRNQVLTRLDQAASTLDPHRRAELLTFLFVGGGYAGVEALAELEEMVRFAVRRYYPMIELSEVRWLLVEAADRIMPEVSGSLAAYTMDVLRDRGIEVRLETTVTSAEDGRVQLSDGTTFPAGTIVWTTGVEANPVIAGSGLPTDKMGRAKCTPSLQVEGFREVFAVGDCAAVPDVTSADPEATCPPTAQHATRQARRAAGNVRALVRSSPLRPYAHRTVGSVATLGLHEGVAEIYGMRLRGWPAWVLHRAYHLAQMPSANRKARIVADWMIDAFFPRQVVALGEVHVPRREFVEQARRVKQR